MLVTKTLKKGDKEIVSESFASSIESSLVEKPREDFDQVDFNLDLDEDDREMDDR